MSQAAPTRAEFEAAPSELLLPARGGSRNPDVLLVEHAGRQVVVKDFRPRGAFICATLGRLITSREARAWQALDGHPAVPRFLGRIDACALAVEYRPGTLLSSKRPVGPAFVPALGRAIEEMHARGVVHLDLKHRSNVLSEDATGRPLLIDFGSAFTFRPGSWMARFVLPLLARIDRLALEKWRRKLR